MLAVIRILKKLDEKQMNYYKIKSSINKLMPTIQLPTHDHIDQISQLNNKYLINNLTDAQKQNGFIRIAYGRDSLTEIINHKEMVIAIAQDNVVGYYLICKTSQIPTLEYQKNKAITLFDTFTIPVDKIGYGCQVCIDEAYRNNGLFTSMLADLVIVVKDKYSHLLCSVSDDNDVSLNAHTSNGWQLLDDMETTNYYIYNTSKTII